MASLGKCTICTKTCYQLEGHRVGPPGKEVVFHKRCFKCQNEGCGWQLTLTSYRYCDGKIWCQNHEPMKGFSNTAHAKGKVEMESMSVEHAVQAPKLNTVNEQLRSVDKPQAYGMDSIAVKNAMAAPKLSTTNEQVRGSGQVGQYGLDSIGVQNALSAPKAATLVNEQDRSVKRCPSCDNESQGANFCVNCGTKLN